MEEYAWLFTLPSLIVMAQIGNFIHFLNKKVRGETLADIKGYFTNNAKSTIIAVTTTWVSATALYFTLATGEPIDLLTVFGLGYMSDSFFNKWDKPQ